MPKKILRSNRGVTLIELITAMAIVSLVLLMVFSFMGYGNAAFSQGKAQNTAQSSLRIANDYIVKNLRFATSVYLSPNHPGVLAVDNVYDYIYIEGDTIYHSAYNGGSTRTLRQLADGLQSGTSFWAKRAFGTQLVGMDFFGIERNQNFSLSSGIELPNVALKGNFIQDVSDAQTIVFVHHYAISGNPPAPPGLTSYAIVAVADPTEGGILTGDGIFVANSSVTVLSTPNPGYNFVHWREGVNILTTSPSYTFPATANRVLLAVFNAVTAPPTTAQVQVYVTTNRTGNQEYRFTLGTQTQTTKSPYEVIFGSISTGVPYDLYVHRKSGSNWIQVDYRPGITFDGDANIIVPDMI